MFRKRVERKRSSSVSKLPTLIVTCFFWMLLGALLFLVDPVSVADFMIPQSYLVFFVLLFLALYSSANLVLSSVRRGLLIALPITLFFFLRLWGIGSIFNFILLFALFAFLELALSKT